MIPFKLAATILTKIKLDQKIKLDPHEPIYKLLYQNQNKFFPRLHLEILAKKTLINLQ